jgi:hypothetical protein
MEAACILTGYNNLSLSLVNPLTPGEDAPNVLSTLLDQYIDIRQCQYDDPIKKIDEPPISLQGSQLLCQLPWLTPWADMFQTLKPVMVEFQLNEK